MKGHFITKIWYLINYLASFQYRVFAIKVKHSQFTFILMLNLGFFEGVFWIFKIFMPINNLTCLKTLLYPITKLSF